MEDEHENDIRKPFGSGGNCDFVVLTSSALSLSGRRAVRGN